MPDLDPGRRAPLTVDQSGRIEGRLTSPIAHNLTMWRIPKTLAIALIAVPLPALPVAIALGFASEHWLDWLTEEDGVVEWLQVVALAIAVGAYLVLTRRHWRADRRLTAVLSILVALGIVVIIGEELSWGQRILGLATPPALDALNEQGETNLHNIRYVATTSRLMQFAMVGYGLLGPLLTLLPGVPRRLTASFFLPPLALMGFFLGPFIYWFVRIPVEPTSTIFHLSEITELSAYSGLAALGLLSLWRLRGGSVGSAGDDPPQAWTTA
jgi:hypothetical protein